MSSEKHTQKKEIAESDAFIDEKKTSPNNFMITILDLIHGRFGRMKDKRVGRAL
jgi:hypothetical protein